MVEKEAAKTAANREKKKKKKKSQAEKRAAILASKPKFDDPEPAKTTDEVEIEYVSEASLLESAPEELREVLEKFGSVEKMFKGEEDEEKDEEGGEKEKAGNEDSDDDGKPKLSVKRRMKDARLSIAELKQLVDKPEVVEVWDPTAADPQLLVHLKSYRNTVPVPRHWSLKRKYLQGKRGLEKPPWALPAFIAATGIEKIRQTIQEKEEKLKGQARARTQPKMGKIDIDYQILHDAFFRYQTKPKLSIHGDIYYEGKENEKDLKDKKPGHLSESLRKALGMPEGNPPPPPPWLINMQRYGPPPSYPNLKIPGLNCPIPAGATWGYHPGGWGKPPVDQAGNPIYGDVYGTATPAMPEEIMAPVERRRWGELDEEEEEEEEEEEQEQEQPEQPEDDDEVPPEPPTDGTASVMAGMETPAAVELRKGSGMETPDVPIDLRKRGMDERKELYQVLEAKDAHVGGQTFGSNHVYDMEKKDKRKPDVLKGLSSDVDITLNPEDLEGLDQATLQSKYREQLQANKSKRQAEDFSDLIEENEKKRRKKEASSKKDKSKFKF